MLVVLNSPGAALIGDNLTQIVRGKMGEFPTVIVESPGYSQSVWNGYAHACEELIAAFSRRREKKPEGKRVNLLGLSIFQKNYRGDLEELERLLGLCGIGVNCALCCQCALEEIRALPEADLNVVVRPEYGLSSARLLEDTFGMPWLSPGLPMGFRATEEWLKAICARLDCDPTPALLECERGRATAYLHISRVNSLTGMPKGVSFAVHGTCSECLGYVGVLAGYFGMRAETVCVLSGEGETPEEMERLRALLRSRGMEEALERDILESRAALVFADANILAKLKLGHHRFTGIEIALPSFGYIDVIPKTHLGVRGALLLCESVLNGLLF